MLGDMGFDSQIGRVLMVLATSAGSMIVSHANDSYFWVVSQFSDMDVSTAYKCQTIGSFVTGVTGIIVIAIISFFVL